MFNKAVQDAVRALAQRLVGPLLATPITPNTITTIGLLFAVLVAWLVGAGYLLAGGLVLAVSSITDIADGALARARNAATDYGAFYDSLLDRMGEAVIGLGIIVYYINHGHAMEGTVLTYLGIVGALMVSYARARAEGLGLECKVGFMARPERIVVTCIGLVLAQPLGLWILTACLWILVVTTCFTTAQRLWHVFTVTHPDRQAQAPSRLVRKRRAAS
jgi:CDP-diacylglycerol--glycerol-3-phosphate 3-phosphatidyltransferase